MSPHFPQGSITSCINVWALAFAFPSVQPSISLSLLRRCTAVRAAAPLPSSFSLVAARKPPLISAAMALYPHAPAMASRLPPPAAPTTPHQRRRSPEAAASSRKGCSKQRSIGGDGVQEQQQASSRKDVRQQASS